ncbi:MAG: hypothetical protein K2Y01_00850 [Rhabdochlamydiaceae bacterium]|nr:hypothetical protein [Rhabdochlamydiaceae bacterium]
MPILDLTRVNNNIEMFLANNRATVILTATALVALPIISILKERYEQLKNPTCTHIMRLLCTPSAEGVKGSSTPQFGATGFCSNLPLLPRGREGWNCIVDKEICTYNE